MPLITTTIAPASSASAEITIRRRNPGKFAPDGIYFEVTNLQGFDTPATHAPTGNVYEPQFHDIEVFWVFGDPGSVYSAPTNTLTEHKNRNVAKGHQAAHVYRTPGDYTIMALLKEPSSGKTCLATLTLTGDTGAITDAVKDPDTVFAGNKTIFIGTAQNGANVDPSWDTFSTYAAMVTAYAAGTGGTAAFTFPGGDTRIMFAGGHAESLNTGIFFNQGHDSVYFCQEPGGSQPVLTLADATTLAIVWFDANSPDQYCIAQDVKVLGNHDPELNNDYSARTFMGASLINTEVYMLADKVTTEGLKDAGIGTSSSGFVGSQFCVIEHDCTYNGWIYYGIYVSSDNYRAILGCSIKQPERTISGGPDLVGSKEYFNRQGPARISNPENFIMDGCDVFSKNGWTSAGDGIYAPQPALRLNTGLVVGAKYNVSRSTVEGGFNVIEATTFEGVKPPADMTHNLVVDSCILIIGLVAINGSMVKDRLGGSTYRNLLLHSPDMTPPIKWINRCFTLDPTADPGGISLVSPVKIYNNTWINQLSPENVSSADSNRAFWDYGSVTSDGKWDDVLTIENNIDHQPNAIDSVITYAPLDTTALFTPEETGYRVRWNFYAHTLASALSAGGNVIIPFPSRIRDHFGTIVEGSPEFSGGMVAADIADDDSWCYTSATVYRDGASGIAVDVVSTGVRLTNNTGAEVASGTALVIVLDQYGNNPANFLVLSPNPIPTGSIWSGKPVNDPGGLGVSTAINGYSTGLRAAGHIGSDIEALVSAGTVPARTYIGAWEETA